MILALPTVPDRRSEQMLRVACDAGIRSRDQQRGGAPNSRSYVVLLDVELEPMGALVRIGRGVVGLRMVVVSLRRASRDGGARGRC